MIERLWYRNEDGGAIEFSVYSDFHVNVSRDVDGLSDVANKISSESTFGQDGETYVSSSIEARDVDIIGHLRT
ncbi:MAG: phage tail family protein, partial [Clostridia bacterium]